MARKFKELRDPVISDPVRREHIEQQVRAIRDVLKIAALRPSDDVAQQQVADARDVTQANILRIEHEEDLYLSTLSGYVAALGGRLEIRAVFPDQTVELVAPER